MSRSISINAFVSPLSPPRLHVGKIRGFDILVPRLPLFFNVIHRKAREPVNIYHVHNVGVEATWEHGALIMTQQF